MDLFDLATFLALLVVALQYLINNFLADWLEEYWEKKHEKDTDLAGAKRKKFVRNSSWVILVLFIAAVVLAVIGLL